MNRLASTLLVSLVAVATACGGGSGGGGVVTPPPGGSGTLEAAFMADPANPGGANTVAMGQGSANGDLVTVEVDITDVSGIYGVAFDVRYDSNNGDFVNWVPGTLLEQDGQTPTYQVTKVTGRVVVVATRQGTVPGANAVGRVTVIQLRFRVENPGAFAVTFEGQTLLDDQVPPQRVPGIGWFGGTLVGN